MRSRRRRASTGATPPLLTATIMGSRSMIAGTRKSDSSRRSTAFTGMPAARAASATRASISARPVAAMARVCPFTSPATKPRARCVTVSAATSSASSCPSRGATTVTFAPDRRSSRTLQAASSPPPTTRTGRFDRSIKTGKWLIVPPLSQSPTWRSCSAPTRGPGARAMAADLRRGARRCTGCGQVPALPVARRRGRGMSRKKSA